MNFLPITSDMQTLELAYSLHSSLSRQCLSFNDCPDLSLGLIETNSLKAVLSVQASLARLEDAVVTLQSVKAGALDAGKVVVRLEPLQQMSLRFESGKSVIDDISLMLPDDTPYYALVQHLVMGRLEVVLAETDIFYLSISAAAINETFAELLKLRAYRYSEGMYSKFLLMTNTANVLP